jgi:RHS repeat-associated protein
LPPLATFMSQARVPASTRITAAAGGRVATADGRVVVDFPAGAAPTDLSVSITDRPMTSVSPPSPDRPIVGLWRFEAFEAAGSHAPVHLFNKSLTITVRFGANDLIGRDARNLIFWTFDEPSQTWLPVPSELNVDQDMIIGHPNHFSDDAVTATKIVSMAPLLDGRNVDLHSGAASFSIPIQLPPGRGGLTPQLSLDYNSERLGGMKGYTSNGSWVGTGWELDVPNIQFSEDPVYDPDNFHTRAFLSLGGLGGEMVPDPVDPFTWRLRGDPYTRIHADCDAPDCAAWTVTDKRGTQYVFGTTSPIVRTYERYYIGQPVVPGGIPPMRLYRADVRYIRDVLGNQIDFTYQQYQVAGPYGTDVMNAYPSRITYNGGQTTITFDQGCDVTDTSTSPNVCVRNDTPRSMTFANCPAYPYVAPEVREMKRLDRLQVWSGASLAREYGFFYDTTPFTGSYFPTCPPSPFSGEHTLNRVELRDRQEVAYPFTTTTFNYASEHHAFYGTPQWDYNWKHLEQVNTAFGGVVAFTYAEKGITTPGSHWSRSVVTQERHSTSGQPDVITAYDYPGVGPDEQDTPSPLYPNGPADPFGSEYRGFKSVTETDAAGNTTAHSFYTTGAWADEVRTGREYDTVVKDALGVQWQRAQHTWSIRAVSNLKSGTVADYYVNFVYPSSVVTTLRDGTALTANNTFDNGTGPFYGLLTQVDDQGEPGAGDRVITNTAYSINTTAWMFLPRYVEKLDADNGNALLGCARSYYDGATTTGANPTLGLVTAVSTAIVATAAQCEGTLALTSSTNSYSLYDAYGNVVNASVPTSIAPESATLGTCGTSASLWLPSGVLCSATVYDATFHIFPTSQTNVLGQATSIDYDYVIGKPISTTEPNGHHTTVVYDSLGRVIRSYDDLDSDPYPTLRYTYVWDRYPLMTRTETTTIQGTATTRVSLSCMDGFGREVEHRENFNGGNLMSVRTEYDSRGLKSTKTNPVDNGADTNCIGPSSPSTQRDRSLFSYDPLGNVTSTMSVAANQYSGPSTQAIYNGKTTTTFDEKFNRTDQLRSFTGRTLTVKQPSSAPVTTTLRPTGQGFYSQWAFAVPNQAHYLNVQEAVADDNASEYDDGGWNRKDTQAYPSAGLATGATINAVRFKFRWKHLDNITPDPGNEIWTVFRQSGVDTRGPAYHRTNADGWGLDSWEMSVNPRTGQPWTVAELNAGLEFGFEIYPNGGAHPYITQAYVEVVTAPTYINSTVYHYDGAGHLIDVTDPLSNKTSLTYDLAGRKLTMDDRDMGFWTYTYDSAGSLATQTDAKGVVTTIAHDAAERPTSKTYSSGDPTVSFLYDTYPSGGTTGVCPTSLTAPTTAVGRLTRMAGTNGAELPCYDVRGRVLKTRKIVDGKAYDIGRTFDPLGQVTQMTYPDSDVVTFNEAPQGNITGLASTPSGQPLQTLMSGAVPKPWAATSSIALGNGSTTSYTYDFRTRLTGIQTGSAQNLALTYDAASNVATATDNTGTPETVTYGYDQLNRLTSASGFAGGQTAAYSYDAIGNMLTKQEGSASNLTLTYPNSYAGSVRPHAVTSTTGTQALTLTYDANGNLSTQGASNYAFDAENRLRVRDDANGGYSYDYDGNGALIKRTVLGPAQTATVRPNAQGFYSQWNATPNVAHYLNVAEAVADDNGSYIEQATPALNDTHLYPTANVPPNALIDKVTLKARWEATGTVGALYPMYRQGGVDKIPQAGIGHFGTQGYVNDSFAYPTNPVTGGSWTAAQVNSGTLEFGFRTGVQDYTPRVTQAWLEVTYHVPTTTSTIYIAGVYEKNSDGSIVKYYGAGGAKAMRKVPSGGGAGTLSWVLSDHLGSASTITDSLGAVVSTQKYWPYGATRSTTGTLPTDKQYTGQQIEPGDALGLYNYKARFYSTVVGRFVSADTVAQDLHGAAPNRYTYTSNNPMRYIDPSGHCFTWLGTKLPCGEGDARAWLTCGIAPGACAGDLLRMAQWALGLREFYNNVMSLIAARPDFRKEVHDIRGPITGTSREMSAGLFITGVGEEGKKPNDAGGASGPPLPATLDADRIRGSVKYWIDYSYVDYMITAVFNLSEGDARKWHLSLHVGPGEFYSANPWETYAGMNPIHARLNVSLFDGHYKELSFSVAPNSAAFENPLLVTSIGTAHSGAIGISMANWDADEE